MLDIDVNALAVAVDALVQVHWLSNQTSVLMGVLDRLRDAIRSPRWNRRMTFFQVKTEEIPNDNPDAARREFAKLMPITEEEDDLEVLQTFISLYGSTLSFARVIGVCDHILRLTDELSVRMQYTAVKAVQYLLIGDIQQAGLLFDQVAAMARETGDLAELDPYEEWLFASTLSHLGLIKRQPHLLDEAIEILTGQLATDIWKPSGIAGLHKLIGDCHRYAGRWNEAENAYRAALGALENAASRISLAEALMRQGRPAEAATTIDAVRAEGLEREEYEDYAFGLAAIAVESGERTRMVLAARKLEGFESPAPYFERRRLLLLLRVRQAITQGRTPKAVRSIRRLVAATARSISRYAILEPNWQGIGVNLNRALDDLADQLDPLENS